MLFQCKLVEIKIIDFVVIAVVIPSALKFEKPLTFFPKL
jgi:hypothetical protein